MHDLDVTIVNRLNTIESSICDMFAQMQQVLSVAQNNQASYTCQPPQENQAIKAIEKKMDRLTDSMNRKLAEINNKLPTFAKVAQLSTLATTVNTTAAVPTTHGGDMTIATNDAPGDRAAAADDMPDEGTAAADNVPDEGTAAADDVSECPSGANAENQSKESDRRNFHDPNLGSTSSATSDQRPRANSPDVMLIGDSNVRHIRPNGLISNRKVVRVELENKTLRGARNFVRNMKTTPQQLIIQCGGNDAARNSTQVVLKDVKELLQTTTEVLPNTGVTFTMVFHQDVPAEKAVSLDRQLSSLCLSHHANYLSLIDICSTETNFTDTRHLNRKGITQLVKLYKYEFYPKFGLTFQEYQPWSTQRNTSKGNINNNNNNNWNNNNWNNNNWNNNNLRWQRDQHHAHAPSDGHNDYHFVQPWKQPIPTTNRFTPLMVTETLV